MLVLTGSLVIKSSFGPIAQLVRAVDSSKGAPGFERARMNGMNSGKP